MKAAAVRRGVAEVVSEERSALEVNRIAEAMM